ncbi:hypothetical protein BJ508DRAFT_182633 [Ascobolus immersus RN42]|uniref:Uncharacterized protein n=1 Tax=Ascobolus immersus RN42 TaxID=1160509 RepID=A0A3N4HS31_ASCIM|nr:hypothetical protein BJ508DRAFT_182633 [Ascobolus immersus RN42]
MATQEERLNLSNAGNFEAVENHDALLRDFAAALTSAVLSLRDKDEHTLKERVYSELAKFRQQCEGRLQRELDKRQSDYDELLSILGSCYVRKSETNDSTDDKAGELPDFVQDHFSTIPRPAPPSRQQRCSPPVTPNDDGTEDHCDDSDSSDFSDCSPDSDDDEFDKVSIKSGASDRFSAGTCHPTFQAWLLSEKARHGSAHPQSSSNSPVVQGQASSQFEHSRLATIRAILSNGIGQWRDSNAPCTFPACEKRFRDEQQAHEKEMDQLRRRLDSASSEKQVHQVEKNKLIEDVAHQAAFAGDIQKTNTQLKQKIRELEYLERGQRAEVASLKKQKKKLEEELEELDAGWDRELKRSGREVTELTAQNESLRREIASLQAHSNVLGASLNKVQAEKKSLESELRERFQALQNRFEVEQQAHSAQIAAHDKTGEKLRAEMAKSFEQSQTIKSLEVQLEKEILQHSALNTRQNSLITKIDAITEKEGLLHFELDALNKQYDEKMYMVNASSSNPNLQETSVPTFAKVKRLGNYLGLQDGAIKRLQDRLEFLTRRCEAFEDSFEAGAWEKDSLAAAVLYEVDRSDSLTIEKDDLQKKKDLLETELDEARIDVHEMRIELIEAEAFKTKLENGAFRTMYYLSMVPFNLPATETDRILTILDSVLRTVPHLQQYQNTMELNMGALRAAISDAFPDYPHNLAQPHGQTLKEFVEFSKDLSLKVRNIQNDLDDLTRFYRGNAQDLHACIDRVREHNEDLKLQFAEIRAICKSMYRIIWNDVSGFEEKGTTVAVLRHIEACLPDLLVQDKRASLSDADAASHVRVVEADCRLLKELNWELNRKVADLEAQLVNVDDAGDLAYEKELAEVLDLPERYHRIQLDLPIKKEVVSAPSTLPLPDVVPSEAQRPVKKEEVVEEAKKMVTAQMLASQAAVKYNEMFPKTTVESPVPSLVASRSCTPDIPELVEMSPVVLYKTESRPIERIGQVVVERARHQKDQADLEEASEKLRRLLCENRDAILVGLEEAMAGDGRAKVVYYDNVSQKHPEMTMEEIIDIIENKKGDHRVVFEDYEFEFGVTQEVEAKQKRAEEASGNEEDEDVIGDESFHSAPSTPVPSDATPLNASPLERPTESCGVSLTNIDEPLPKAVHQLRHEESQTAAIARKQLEPSPVIQVSKPCNTFLPPLSPVEPLEFSWLPGRLNIAKVLQPSGAPLPPYYIPLPLPTLEEVNRMIQPVKEDENSGSM